MVSKKLMFICITVKLNKEREQFQNSEGENTVNYRELLK